MKLNLPKNVLSEPPETSLRQAGYAYIYDRKMGKESFVRRLGGGFYPRFHMYLEQNGEYVILNLHLDQKQASYKGAHMHNAEYDGDTVAQELARIRPYFGLSDHSIPAPRPMSLSSESDKPIDSMSKIGPPSLDLTDYISDDPPKSWWRKLLGL